MTLTRLSLRNFRNLAEADLAFAAGVSLIWGGNGAGKTNLLEAILVACRGDSPRTRLEEDLIRWGSDYAQVAAALRRTDRELLVEVALGRQEGKRFRVNGVARPRREALAGLGGAVYFSGEDLEILQGDPSARRRFLDEELSVISHSYYWNLHHYRRCLGQRNRLLREAGARGLGGGGPNELESWDDQLLRFGARLVRSRLEFLRGLQAQAGRAYGVIADDSRELSLSYRLSLSPAQEEASPGRPSPSGEEPLEAEGEEALEQKLRAALASRRREELERGMTLVGPHRDDVLISLEGRPARFFASQGEQRTAAIALRLGVAEMIGAGEGEAPLLLLDDVFSELDPGRRRRLLAACGAGGESQALITLCDPAEVPEARASASLLVQVEGGVVK